MINHTALQVTLKSQPKTFVGLAKAMLLSFVLSAVIVPHASAHLMVAQNGTLNFKGSGAFMVLSLPVSAFENIDDDGDGKMSAAEFNKHKSAIMNAVKGNVRLSNKQGPRPLQGLLLSPVASHTVKKAPANQLIVMGRFSLTTVSSTSSILPISNKKVDAANNDDLSFHLSLFGKNKNEKIFILSATRKLSVTSKTEKAKVELTPTKPEGSLFAK